MGEYFFPMRKITSKFSSINSIDDLERFIQERAAHVTQTTLYGYLKTRIGTRYVSMMGNLLAMLLNDSLDRWVFIIVISAQPGRGRRIASHLCGAGMRVGSKSNNLRVAPLTISHRLASA